MSFVDPRFVEIYEQIDGDRTEDIAHYVRIAQEALGPVLEAGCGSGRILLPILRQGVEISGFDPSEAMLDVLRKRAQSEGLAPDVWPGDFTSIDSTYASIISPFNSMMHLLTQDEQVDAFRRVYDALQPGGVFAFDIVNPHTLDIYDDEVVFDSTFIDQRTDKQYEIWRWFEHDPVSQCGKFHREFRSRGETLHSVIDFRWIYPSEIELLLRLSGFKEWELFGGFNSEPLEADSTSQVWVAAK